MTNKPAKYSRRSFLRAGGAAALLGPLLSFRSMAAEDKLIKKRIPVNDETLAVIGLGTSRTFEVSTDPASLAPLRDLLQAFFDHSGQVIDSSPMYGSAETVTGKLLAQTTNKQNLFAATKVWTNGKQSGIEQMTRSMNRMGITRFDLMQIHNLRDWRIHLETLEEWKAQGKIRYLGITTSHGRYHDDLERILLQVPFDFVQFSYNIVDRAAERRLLPLARERGIATLINRPYQRGSLFRRVRGQSLPAWASEFDCASWGQFFLKFIAAHPDVTCVIPATSKLKHLVDNMAAGFGRLPDDALRARMARYVESL